ncbi:TetR/AcrR family transcriptional regulator [Dactylosporangium sp. NPDC051541]|uniref:TetR/AcrR family transcriptional regulator n=1 Tax=Dactylosporangium sp. NPDC051541 TaxID=3363977 RepID=UPI00379FF79B
MLREEKKARARAAMADAAAELFAAHGYDSVAMAQVARAAGVSEQTLYNYFPTKESLVFDQADAFEATMLATLAARGPDTSVVDAYGRWLQAFLLGPDARRAVETPGGMVRQIAVSNTLHRAMLDLAHRVATVLATRLRAAEGYPPAAATTLADALIAVFVRTVERLSTAPSTRAIPAIRRQAREAVEALRPLLR